MIEVLESKVPCCVCGRWNWRKAELVTDDALDDYLRRCGHARGQVHIVCTWCTRDLMINSVGVVRVASQGPRASRRRGVP
jgi:hypothetical protein